MVSEKVIVKNVMGFHARPAAILTQIASRYNSKIDIIYKDKNVTAKSILGIMSMGIHCGDEIEIRCEGTDEIEALGAIIESINKAFGEES